MDETLVNYLEGCLQASSKAPQMIHFHGNLQTFQSFLSNWRSVEKGILVRNLADPLIGYFPFCPFLEAFRTFHGSHSMDDAAWQNVGALPAHERSLRRWLNGEDPDREDFPSAGEVDYERKRLIEATLRVMEEISFFVPIRIAVLNAQHLPRESADMILTLESRGLFRGFILLQYDWGLLSLEDRETSWLVDFRIRVSVTKGFHQLGSSRLRGSPRRVGSGLRPPASVLPLCREFLSCQTGLNAVARLLESSPLSPEGEARLQFYRGWFYDRLHPSKSAESAFSRAEAVTCYQGAIEVGGSGPAAIDAMVDLALMHYDMGDLNEAFDWADRARDLSEKHSNTAARAEVVRQMVTVRRKEPGDWESFESALDRLFVTGALNIVVYGLLYCIPVDAFSLHRVRAEGYLDRGLTIASTMGHLAYQSSALHLKSVIISMTKGEAAARPFLEECIRIREQLGDNLFFIIAHNGLSYSLLTQWRVGEAFSSLVESLKVLMNVRDFNEIAMTLYNMAMVHLYGRCFESALELLLTILQIMHALGLRKLPFVPLANISLFRAYCLLEKENDTVLFGFATFLEKDVEKITEPVMPFYILFKALLRDKMEGTLGAPPVVDWASLENYLEVRTLIRPFFHLEWAFHCRRLGSEVRCRDSLREGLACGGGDKGSLLVSWYQEALSGKDPAPFPFPPLDLDLPSLVGLARHEQDLRGMQRKLQNIQFVNRTIESLARCADEDGLLATLHAALSRHYPGAGIAILVLDPQGNEPKIVSSVSGASLSSLKTLLRDLPGGIYNPGEEGKALRGLDAFYTVLLYPFRQEGGVEGGIIIGSDSDQSFRPTDKDLISLLMSNFTLKFVAIRQHSELEFQAHFDSLSKLNNRMGLYRRMSIEQNRLLRQNTSSQEPQFAVCFLDLDNFKRYNDTYGHRVGDYLISEMGNLLTSTFRETDICARFGGDEFVVLLPDTGAEEAVTPAKRLLELLRAKGGFEKEVGFLLGQAVSIPERRWLSCSIGIAGLTDLPTSSGINIEALLKLADEALYVAKESGKNRIARVGPVETN